MRFDWREFWTFLGTLAACFAVSYAVVLVTLAACFAVYYAVVLGTLAVGDWFPFVALAVAMLGFATAAGFRAGRAGREE